MIHYWKLEMSEIMAHPVLHDEGVEACRNACVGGASISAAAITIAAYCENPFTGLPALRECMERLLRLPLDLDRWCSELGRHHPAVAREAASPPGFGYVAGSQAGWVREASARLAARCRCTPGARRLEFFMRHRTALERALGPLNPTGLSAFAFADHGVSVDEAERCYLQWRMEPALREAQHARSLGLSRFPFMSERFEYEGPWPARQSLELTELERELGLA